MIAFSSRDDHGSGVTEIGLPDSWHFIGLAGILLLI